MTHLKFIKKILLPEVIIFVKADIETINNRIETRGGTVQWYGDAVTQNNSVESAYHKVFKWFDIPIVEVDTSEKYGRSVEENYLLMKDQVEHVLSGGSNLYSF